MNTIKLISKEALDKSGLSFDNALSYAANTGLLTAGMVLAYNATRLLKKENSLLVNAGGAVASIVGAMFIKNPMAKLGLLGMAAFLGVKSLGLLTNVATTPGATAGLGFIPDAVKSQIRQFIPTLGAVDVPFEEISNTVNGNEEINLLGLDSPIEQALLGNENNEEVSGLGDAGMML